jgi:hypothetical protein
MTSEPETSYAKKATFAPRQFQRLVSAYYRHRMYL